MKVFNLTAHDIVVEEVSGRREIIPPASPDHPLRVEVHHQTITLDDFPLPVVHSFIFPEAVCKVADELVQRFPEGAVAVLVSFRVAKALAQNSEARKRLRDRKICVFSPDSFDGVSKDDRMVKAVSQFRYWI